MDAAVKADGYLEPSRTSTMELLCENSSQLLDVNYFCKQNMRQCNLMSEYFLPRNHKRQLYN